MTNQERAEKIGYDVIERICHIVDRNIYSEDILKAIVPEITSQLDEAVAEACASAVRETELRLHYGQIHLAQVAGKLEGFASAREKAAGIAENPWDYIPQETWDEGFEPDRVSTQKMTAERIRNLKVSPDSENPLRSLSPEEKR